MVGLGAGSGDESLAEENGRAMAGGLDDEKRGLGLGVSRQSLPLEGSIEEKDWRRC